MRDKFYKYNEKVIQQAEIKTTLVYEAFTI